MWNWITNVFKGNETTPVKIKQKMEITDKKRDLIKRILNSFEQGREFPKHDELYVYNDGSKGRQITLSSGITEEGNLKFLIEKYISTNGKFSKEFIPYFPKIGKISLVNDVNFKNLLLRAAREDSVYRGLIDKIYDEKYIDPAFAWARNNGFTEVLSFAVIADSYLHSGQMMKIITNKFAERTPINGGRERIYIESYLEARKEFLRNHKRTILNKLWTRPQFYLTQAKKNNWALDIFPIAPNGVTIKS